MNQVKTTIDFPPFYVVAKAVKERDFSPSSITVDHLRRPLSIIHITNATNMMTKPKAEPNQPLVEESTTSIEVLLSI